MAAPPITTRRLVGLLGPERAAVVAQWLRSGALVELRELRVEDLDGHRDALRRLSVVVVDELGELRLDAGDGDEPSDGSVADDESE